MPFYIRKAFSSGPIRLNLSKGGLGFSLGVKGARLGVNSRGQAYVHGGRHGVYYRKNLGSGSGSTRDSRNSNSGSILRIFEDTGVTYSPPERFEHASFHRPDIQPPPKWLLSISLIGLVLAIWNWAWFALSLVAISIYGYRYRSFQKKRDILNTYETLFEDQPISEEYIAKAKTIFSDVEWSNSIGILFLRHEVASAVGNATLTQQEVKKYRDLGVDSKALSEECEALYESMLDHLVNDHQLDPREEALLEQLALDLDLSEACIQRNKWLIDYYKTIWEEAQRPLESVDISRELKRGETAYFENDGARLLVERVQDRFQHHGQRYTKVGYEIDMEGIVRVTSRVIEIDDGYIREYYIKYVRDIEFSIESQTVEIQLSNRKSPLVITCPEAMRLGMVLEKVVEKNEK
jgi:hypothetical protein